MNLNYKMTVEIYDPNSPEGLCSCERLSLFCEVSFDAHDFGNGCFVYISGEGFSNQIFDVRYDKSFDFNKADVWLKKWAQNYWNGVNGAWSIKRLKILKLY